MNGNAEIIQLLNQELLRLQARNPQYSIRAFARKLNIYPSALSELLNGKRRFTPSMAERVLFRLGVDPSTSHAILKSLSPLSRKNRSKKMDTLTSPKESHQLNMDKFHILADWFYFAVYSLAETADFKSDPKWIARRLAITIPKARLALERLERIGLFERDSTNCLRTTGIQITTSSDITNLSLQRSHFQNLELAKNSLEQDGVDVRDFSSISMATSASKIREVKERIKVFRRQLCAFLEDVPTEEKKQVYQMNVQLFPLTKDKKGE